MDNLTQNTIDSLDDLLEEERKALLEGNLDVIARLSERKESLMDDLNAFETQSRAELEDLNTKVERNQLLLNNALEGIRTVARRLALLRRVRGTLETYDARGRKETIDLDQKTSVEKRA